MKNLFSAIGVIVLLTGTFIYSDRVTMAVKTTDELLVKIEEVKDDYEIGPIEAIIDENTIIPGKNGKEVDVESSYDKLSQIGYFNDKLLVYKPKYIKNKLSDNRDKFIISGNKESKDVALLFKVSDTDDISKILNILEKEEVKVTFYITTTYFEKNYNDVIRLINDGYTIGNLSNNGDYTDSNFAWMSTVLIHSGKQKRNYCYASLSDKDVLKICNMHNSYTVVPISVNATPFIGVKKNLKSGAIISLDVNRDVVRELESIINYVIGKGYNIKPLEEFFKE